MNILDKYLCILHFFQSFTRKVFAQFNAKLIKAINIPDHAFNENLMFIKSEKRSEVVRRKRINPKSIARAVSIKMSVRFLRICAAFHQRITLTDNIRKQFLMMVTNIVDGFFKGNEIAWNNIAALMQELEKGVLSVAPDPAKDYGRCLVIYMIAIHIDRFTVGFHL